MALILELEDDDGEFTVTLDADGFAHVFGSGGQNEVDALQTLVELAAPGPALLEHEVHRLISEQLDWPAAKTEAVLRCLRDLELFGPPAPPTDVSRQRLGPGPFYTRADLVAQFYIRVADPETLEWLRELLPDPPDTDDDSVS